MVVVSAKPSSVAIDAIEKRLNELGKESRMNDVLKKAINETAAKGKKELWKGVKRTYTLKEFTAGDVKKKSYSARHPGAVLTVTGPVLGIVKNYEIHNSTSVYKAFVERMKSSHVGIFQRVPNKRMKSNPKKSAIKEIMSLSKSKAAEMIYEKNGMHTELQEELIVRLHKHMNAVIGGLG